MEQLLKEIKEIEELNPLEVEEAVTMHFGNHSATSGSLVDSE